MAQRLAPKRFKENLGNLLYNRRQASGLTQAILGRQIGVKPSMISEYEWGNTMPSIYTLTLLMETFKITTADLVRCADENRQLRSADERR